MTITPASELRELEWVNGTNLVNIEKFLKGAVYTWSKNSHEYFSASDLMGGVNFNWEDTPLQFLHDYQVDVLRKSYEDAIKGAGIALGWLLKKVLDDDKRNYFHDNTGRTARYKWDREGV